MTDGISCSEWVYCERDVVREITCEECAGLVTGGMMPRILLLILVDLESVGIVGCLGVSLS